MEVSWENQQAERWIFHQTPFDYWRVRVLTIFQASLLIVAGNTWKNRPNQPAVKDDSATIYPAPKARSWNGRIKIGRPFLHPRELGFQKCCEDQPAPSRYVYWLIFIQLWMYPALKNPSYDSKQLAVTCLSNLSSWPQPCQLVRDTHDNGLVVFARGT